MAMLANSFHEIRVIGDNFRGILETNKKSQQSKLALRKSSNAIALTET